MKKLIISETLHETNWVINNHIKIVHK